jgi:predicted DNA-binding protein (MmcQ/YjbR family)
MNAEDLRSFALNLTGTSESLPFDNETLVFKVLDKMFLLFHIENTKSFNVKCDPEKAIDLRERHFEVMPGWHMSKIHWNTVSLEGSLSNSFLKEQIEHSYQLVRKSLKVAQKKELNTIDGK